MRKILLWAICLLFVEICHANRTVGGKEPEPALCLVTFDRAIAWQTSPVVPFFDVMPFSILDSHREDYERMLNAYENEVAEAAKNNQKPRWGKPSYPFVRNYKNKRLMIRVLMTRRDGKVHFHINLCRCGVHTVIDDYVYDGEEFAVIARGEDWYLAVTDDLGKIIQ